MKKKIKSSNNNIFFMSIGDLMTSVLFIFMLLFLKEYLTSNKHEYIKLLKKYDILKKEDQKKLKKINSLIEENKAKLKEIKLLEKENSEKLEKINLLEEENEKYKNQDRKIEEIYQKIEKKLTESIKDNKFVKIDTVKQELVLDNSVLFDSGEWHLKEKGKETLRKVLPTFFGTFLDDKEIISYLEQLTIEGHTDETGPGNQQTNYLYNLDLSQKRAFEVVNFIYEDQILSNELNEKRLKKLKIYLSSNGKSNSDLIFKEDETGKKVIDRAKSRRVTIKYKLDIQKIRGIIKR